MAVWYSQTFEALSGDLLGQDGWEAVDYAHLVDPDPSYECLYVTGTHIISGAKSLQCNLVHTATVYPPNVEFRWLKKSLTVIPAHTDHSVQFDLRYFYNGPIWVPAFPPVSEEWRMLEIRGEEKSQGWISWIIAFKYAGNGLVNIHLYDTNSRPTIQVIGTVDMYSSSQNIRVVVSQDKVISVYLNSSILWVGKTYRGDIDRLVIMAYGGGGKTINDSLEIALDNLLVEYTPIPVIAASVPKAPTNVMVNVRDQYAVLSWNPVTAGIVTEEITKGASGDYSDSLTNTAISTSPAITKAIIDGETVVTGLPVEGKDFFVDRSGGIINWVPTSTKAPDAFTDYSVIYEVPVTNVTGYNVYKSNLINEYDEALCATVTTTDINGKLDTAFVDTNIAEVQVYKVAAVNSNVVESELSGKVVAIKIASQIDTKQEVIDRKLWVLDQSRFGEGILR